MRRGTRLGQLRWFTVQDSEIGKYYEVGLTPAQVRRYDNGSLVSLGLRIGDGRFTRKVFERLPKKEISRDQWKHSGCQSSCVLRGQAKCSW